uniref:hypothetical protein n=1 Tax=Flavobacterium sp. TaxID=239 RepID=UPI00404A2D93
MKSNLLYFAMFLMILCIPFRGNENEVSWLWADMPYFPLMFLITALLCIAFYVFKKRISEKM